MAESFRRCSRIPVLSYCYDFLVYVFLVFVMYAGTISWKRQRRSSFDVYSNLLKKDAGAVDVFDPHCFTKQLPNNSQLHVQNGGLIQQIPQMQSQTHRLYNQQVTEKPAANAHEKDIKSSCPSNAIQSSCSADAFHAIDDDEVGKIGSFKEIKGHEQQLSLVVKSKRSTKNIDKKRKLDKKVVSGAVKVVRVAFVLPNITPKDGKSIEPQEHQEREKQSSRRVMEFKKKSENIESRRKHLVTRTYSEVVVPFEEPEREFRRLLRERRKMDTEELNKQNTSKLSGSVAVSSSTQRSHSMVLRRRK